VQIKVKVLAPDEFLRPEMNASVAFFEPNSGPVAKLAVSVPSSAVRSGSVFQIVDGRAVRRPVQALIGGEEIVANPPEDLKEGDKVSRKPS
jgi:HlyD family secretion protein